MRRKVIYVDFVFKHKKVSYFKYYILYLFSSIINSITSIIAKNKNVALPHNEKTKMLK